MSSISTCLGTSVEWLALQRLVQRHAVFLHAFQQLPPASGVCTRSWKETQLSSYCASSSGS